MKLIEMMRMNLIFYDISCYDAIYEGSRKIKDESIKIDKKALKTKEIYEV